jgi:hypothetical protein
MSRTPKEILFLRDRTVKAAYDADAADQAEIDYLIEEAETGVSTLPSWDRRNEAVALLAWHKWQISERRRAQKASGATEKGQIIERQLDNGRTKYAALGGQRYGEGPHGSTEPGAEFDALMASRWSLPEVI